MRALCLVFTVEYSERFFDDLCFSEISQPCFDPVAVAGVCITSKYFFVKFKRGNLSDGWRLDWCVCRKSVNNINFIWINKKVGSGNSHMAFFFFFFFKWYSYRVLNFSNQSFELMTQSHLTVSAAPCLLFLHEIRSVKDVLSNLSFWSFWETLFRLRAELWKTNSVAKTSVLYTSTELTQEPVDLCRFRGKQTPQVRPDTVWKHPEIIHCL